MKLNIDILSVFTVITNILSLKCLVNSQFVFLYSYIDFYSILSVFLEKIEQFLFLFPWFYGPVIVFFFIVYEILCRQQAPKCVAAVRASVYGYATSAGDIVYVPIITFSLLTSFNY